MLSLKVQLLGPPHFEVNGSVVEVNRHKALALLSYLAVTGTPQHRDKLATLFWPDSPQSRARASLRRDLSVLNKALDGDWLVAERDTVGLHSTGLWLDVAHFRQRLAECDNHGHAADAVCSACFRPLREAAELYGDDFMAGFSLPDCPDFDEWQFFERESLRQELSTVLQRLVQGYGTQGEYESALPFARRWLALDALNEAAHRQLMGLYGRTHQQAAALRQYRICVQTLQNELGIAPSSATTALYEQIRRPAPGKKPEEQIAPPQKTAHNLPVQATPFVGRVEGLANISQRLQDPTCRLLTLVGPGGIGKTRLAVQAARNLVDDSFGPAPFATAVFFVPLVSLSSANHLIPAIAHALNFSFYREVDPKQQLLNYLREKEMLLVLDNFEHLLPNPTKVNETNSAHLVPEVGSGADLVADILVAAPRVKFLVTSREALNLREEWIYPVAGMRYPIKEPAHATGPTADLLGYSAVQLFAQSARRIRPDFSLAAEQACVLQICRLVEGMPLAIELAATWLRVLSCTKIVREIERNLDFLTTAMRDVPVRHRSMRAVFAHSWHLLAREEQAILRRLSVFRGGFRQGAAAQVARASLLELAALVEQSLLHASPSGRYHMHGLLRQFCAEKLAEVPEDQDETRNRHSAYFISFLQEREQALRSREQKTALAAIRQEAGNIRVAWSRAVAQGDVGAVEQALDTLYSFFLISSRFQEGEETFRSAVAHLQGKNVPDDVLVRLIARQGTFCATLGMYGLARELLQKSVAMARCLQDNREIAFALDQLGNVFHTQGESIAATALYRESLQISRAIGDQAGTASSLYNQGWICVRQGDYRRAKSHFQDSLTLYRAIENQAGMGHALDSLGMAAFLLGEYQEAEQHYRGSLDIFDELGDRHGTARARGGLGLVAWGVGGTQLPRARQLLEESLRINRAIGHRLEVARRLAFLGSVTNDLGDFAEARTFLEEALSISREIGFTFGIPWSLGAMGTAVLGQGDPAAAAEKYYEAIEIAANSRDVPIILDTIVSLAKLMMQGGASTISTPTHHPTAHVLQAAEILALVINHPAAWQIMKDKAAQLWARVETDLPEEQAAAAWKHGKEKQLEELVVEILTQ